MRILSFEILPWPEGVLKACARGSRQFRFPHVRRTGQTRSAMLYLPVHVDLLCTPVASLDRRQLEFAPAGWYTMTGTDEIGLVDVPIEPRARRLEPAPAIVKIDVEGVGLPALRGISRTLAACRPLLMIEKNDDLRFVRRAALTDRDIMQPPRND